MDERALLELLDRDPNAAMEALLERCGPLLRYVVGGVLRDPQDAEDCYSAVTELLWRRSLAFRWFRAVFRARAVSQAVRLPRSGSYSPSRRHSSSVTAE